MQPQGHVQVMMNLIDFHMNPQEALDAPRWQWTGDMNIEIEQGFPMDMAGLPLERQLVKVRDNKSWKRV